MSGTFLDKIVGLTRKRVNVLKDDPTYAAIKLRAEQIRGIAEPHKFNTSLAQSDRINIIAEIKRSSPSKGVINADIDVANVARGYESGGAAAISVLTETEFFGGSLVDLLAVYQTARIPILRKDFIVDEFQIYEAAANGADAILLIVAALSQTELIIFQGLAHNLGMDALVEVHTKPELEIAGNIGAKIIGVNNRDLKSLDVSLDVSRDLIKSRPANALMISESGLSGRAEIDELKNLGFDGFLIGETLMRSHDIGGSLEILRGQAQ